MMHAHAARRPKKSTTASSANMIRTIQDDLEADCWTGSAEHGCVPGTLADACPTIMFCLEGHVGVVNLFHDRVLGGLGLERVMGDFTEPLDDLVGKRFGRDALVLDQIDQRLAIGGL